MELTELFTKILTNETLVGEMHDVTVGINNDIQVYTSSIAKNNGCVFFIGKANSEKILYIISDRSDNKLSEQFEGTSINFSNSKESLNIKKCPLTTKNRKSLQNIFKYTIAVPLGLNNSFGCGDRIGFANAGHIRSLAGTKFKPILAQQSIRELTRTNRTPDEVMDAAVWAVFQEGYKDGFGSDGDHLKTPADIDYLLAAGFTMFTFDPGEHVDNEADNYSESELTENVAKLPWSELKDSPSDAESRYTNKEIIISDEFILNISRLDILKALAKYGKAIAHIKKMYEHLKTKGTEGKYEVEVSVDETESVTSPFEHYFVVSELIRLGVKFISLAPRFVGSFEKGIDYKGDLDLFKTEYKKHLAVVKHFGNYKISLHSGSDKFSVYKVIGLLREAVTHVKTAGTSYLEALRVVAAKSPDLFREIFNFATGLYEEEKKSYHVSADIKRVKNANDYSDAELLGLFDSVDGRQILHVTFGKVLSTKKENGEFLFKDKIITCLKENEATHYNFIIKHFHKHLEPFN
ncbi:MAG: tagaturonate epimerase family protein [bacterium]